MVSNNPNDWNAANSESHSASDSNRIVSTNGTDLPFRFACNYEKSVETVYTDFATSHSLSYQSLDIICFSRRGKSLADLPSWVPDWSNARDTISANPFAFIGFPDGEYIYRYNASLGIPSSFSFKNDVLEADGMVIDAVQAVGNAWELVIPPGVEFYVTLQQWHHLALGARSQHANDTYVGAGTKHDAFIRTITADHDRVGKRIRIGQGYFDPMVCFAEDGSYSSQLYLDACRKPGFQNLERAVYLSVTRRRFFVTERGYFGLGNPELEVGDSLAILSGCSVPIALKRITTSPACMGVSGRHEYTLAGETFVLGWMDGEAALEKRALERILIR